MTQTVRIKNAHKMIVEVRVDDGALRVRFADGAQGAIPVRDLYKHEALELDNLSLPTPYEIDIPIRGTDEETSSVPWDFARIYCDAAYSQDVQRQHEADLRAMAHHVKRLRNANGWTQARLAAEAGVSRATVNRIENERALASRLESTEKIARALGVRLAALFETSV